MDEKCLSEIESLPILIVDDSTSYRLLLIRHIKAWGEYTLLQAEDGQQALEIIKSRRVGIIISDWEMPNMNGLDLCKAVRELSSHYIYFILETTISSYTLFLILFYFHENFSHHIFYLQIYDLIEINNYY